MENSIWVLTDDRTGNANQAIGLAEAIKAPFTIKKISYNIFGLLPNFLIGKNDFHIDKLKSDELVTPYPQMIISSGRRTAPVALSIKRKSPMTKLIQIMRPSIGEESFDLIILPEHDVYNLNTTNVYRTIGAINRITPTSLETHLNEFKNYFPRTSHKIISVLVGGNTKKYKFTKKDAQEFVKIIERLNINHAAQIFISFSRRTPDETKECFYKSFNMSHHHIYDPIKEGYNPYFGMLAIADFIITTGDSISMNSDVLTSGKALYIYTPASFYSAKHNYFIERLIDLKLARRLLPTTEMLQDYKYLPLYEANNVAKFIKENILDIFKG